MNHALRIFAVLALAFLSTSGLAQSLKGTFYKQQQCECCEAHADYLRKNGFELEIMSFKAAISSSSMAMSLRATSPAKSSRGSWLSGHRTPLVSPSPACPAAFPEWKAPRMDPSRSMP